jgi:hypothetical protein
MYPLVEKKNTIAIGIKIVIRINDAKMKSTLQLKKGAKSNNLKRGNE